MPAIAYTSPFVPVEWIAAHGLQPLWLRLNGTNDGPMLAVTRGICPYTGALVDAVAGIDASALVLTTICDQMRYAAALVESDGRRPVFLLNVPSTWQTLESRKLYLEELRRLGRFLERLGGKTPSTDELIRVMEEYEQTRESLLSARDKFSARQFAEALAGLRGPLVVQASRLPFPKQNFSEQAGRQHHKRAGIRLAVLGGPLLEPDYEWFDILENAGGRIVLDATEGGERTLPKQFDREIMNADPLQALADSYFDAIPDAFRRPNTALYEWLGSELATRQVRGIIFRRYVWCDLWHAEFERLKSWSPVPVLELDAGADDTAARNRTQCRIEAFLEMLS